MGGSKFLIALIHVLSLIRFLFWIILLVLVIAWAAGAQIEPWTVLVALIGGALGSAAKFLESKSLATSQPLNDHGPKVSMDVNKKGVISNSPVSINPETSNTIVAMKAHNEGRIEGSSIKIGKVDQDQSAESK